MEIDKKFLLELFDSQPFPWTKQVTGNLSGSYGGAVYYSFQINSKMPVEVEFDNMSDPRTKKFDLQYKVSGSFRKKKDIPKTKNLQFWSTLKNIFKNFITEYKPERIQWESTEENDEFYYDILPMIAKEFGFKFKRTDNHLFILYK